MSSVGVKHRVSDKNIISVNGVVIYHQLSWLGHISPMSNHRVTWYSKFAHVRVIQEVARGGQSKMRNYFMKSLIVGLSPVSRYRLSGFSLSNNCDQ